MTVNYVKHLNYIFKVMAEDKRLKAQHITLYISLFQFWNLNRFRNPISISRDEMMRLSKIGSTNSYAKFINELSSWQYILYEPSKSALVGSKVHMFTFDTTKGATGNETDDTIGAQETTPSINTKNKLNILNKVNDLAHSQNKNLIIKNLEMPVSLELIKMFFSEKKVPGIEAEKFYNYYESKSWTVGKTSMTNWEAAANNWILKIDDFRNENKSPKPGKLNATTGKDYSKPL